MLLSELYESLPDSYNMDTRVDLLNRWLKNCIASFNDDGDKDIIKITNFYYLELADEPDTFIINIEYILNNIYINEHLEDVMSKIDLSLNIEGYYNLKYTTVLIGKRSYAPDEAKYKRAPHPEAYTQYNLSKELISELNITYPSLNIGDPYKSIFQILNEVNPHDRTYYTYLEAVKSIKNGYRLSTAVSERVAVSLDVNTNSVVLWYNDSIIGIIRGTKAVLNDPDLHTKQLLLNEGVIL
jgi:hypothetical protein